MITAKTYSFAGSSLKETSLPEELFGVKVKPVLLAQAVRVYLSNQRSATAKTKTRGMVAKTTAKMYRQKGTGRARHGSWAAPIFVGGGVAHGPTGTQNYRLEMPAKMKRLALLGALSVKAAKGEVAVLSGVDAATGKTSETEVLWEKINPVGKTLVVVTGETDKFNRAVRNRENVYLARALTLNTHAVLAHKSLIMTREAIAALAKHHAN